MDANRLIAVEGVAMLDRRQTNVVEEVGPLVMDLFDAPDDQTKAWKIVMAMIELLGKREADAHNKAMGRSIA